jgi:LacI family transcriptional regulator, gluconate utilization system Gnt-I transcriptional repressor
MSRHTAPSAPGATLRTGLDDDDAEPVRLVEVARLAGVSSMTVSRALRRPEQVAPITLRAVRAAVAELGYLPNGSASALASSRTRVVAAIVPTLMNSVYASTVHGLSEVLRPAGYELMLGDSAYDPAIEAALVHSFLGRRVDALVLTGVEHDPATLALLGRHRLPVAEIWDLAARPIDMLVGFSNVAAGRAAGRFLAARGRRRWGFVGTPQGLEKRSAKRLRGLRQAARETGSAEPVAAYVTDGMSAAEGHRAVTDLLRRHPGVDAVFCANDALATAALRAAADAGRAVPSSFAVLGFGDFDVAAHTSPSLSTIRIPGRGIGHATARALLARLTGTTPGAIRSDLGFEIVARESV